MTRALRRTMWIAAGLTAIACGNPPPTCSATSEAYRICADEQVWECPVATQEQLDAKKAISDDCKQQSDPMQCTLDARYEMFPMVLVAKCGEGGQVCVPSNPPAPRTASCQMK